MERKYTKYCVLIGAFLINIPCCGPMILGNLFTYMYSLFQCRSLPDADDIDAVRMQSLALVAYCIGGLAVDGMRYRLGMRITMAIGIILVTSCFFLTYFTVMRSTWATAFTFMAIYGAGDGIAVSTSILYAAGWFEDKSVGLAVSVVGSATGIGAYAYNYLVTSYINPENLSPDVSRGEISFFTQSEIIDRVPMVFVVLGGITAVCNVLGFCLLKQAPVNAGHEDENNSKDGNSVNAGHEDENNSKDGNGNSVNGNVVDLASCGVDGNKYADTSFGANGNSRIGASDVSESVSSSTLNMKASRKAQNTTLPWEQTPILDKTTNGREQTNDKTPTQLLKMGIFYNLWFSAMAEAIGLLVVSIYFKMFGQLWIADDKLLAIIGGVSSLLTTVSRPICGLLIDKLGVKNVLVIHTASGSFFLSLWYFTAMYNKWLYFFWTNVLFAMYFNQFVLYPIVCLKMFGPSSFATNCFLFQMAQVPAMLGSLGLTCILETLGWFWLFFFGAVTAFASLVLLVVRMPS